ncbi:ferredoxin [Saccharothrix variisporea]|uniref:Sulfoxide reductase heme-binding subunit YedZ n=1 Tax=Saccharothrix variisporea TaxID=543527 RepID=A0A495X7Z6_9PSEU|nr:ferredoxin [Saccharothrix variisporea]RKT70077.1 sulfoxide reductase heme-binding subunit YedZ [Saccharothrix variisporea]
MSSTVEPWFGRLAYVAMCLTICCGVLTATGWLHGPAGRGALRRTHQVLGTFSVVLGVLHAMTSVEGLPIGALRHALGMVGLAVLVAVAVTAALQRSTFYRSWLPLHRLAYVAVWLGAMHAWLGAAANGTVPVLWLAGITVLVPTITITLLRFLPPPTLVRLGIIAPSPTRRARGAVRVEVDHGLCRHFALCQVQAPQVFRVLEDGTLRYARNPEPEQAARVAAAARACPMRAVRVEVAGVRG